MARNPEGKQTPMLAPADDGRKEFELTAEQSDQIRSAIELDDGSEDGHVEAAWRQIGTIAGFDPETLILAQLPDSGPIKITAMPVEPAAPAAEADAGAPPAGDAGAAEDDADADDRDAEAQQSRGLQLMEEAASEMELDSATLVGDLTAGLLNIVQNLQKPWSAHSQHEKRDLVAKLEHIAKVMARQAVDVVAADDRITVKAILDKIVIGDKVQINLTLGAMAEDDKAEAIANLFHAQKKSVLIVTADADRHMGKRREHVAADEEELPFDAGRDPKPAAPAQPAPPADDSDLADGADGGEGGDESGADPD